MKLEFLDDISDEGRFPGADPNQLVRLYDFDHIQAIRLRDTIETLLLDNKQPIDLTQLDFIESVNCKLVLQIADSDKGITTHDYKTFVCKLTVQSYDEMVLLINPFCQTAATGYEWLYDLDTTIDLLFSPGGTW